MFRLSADDSQIMLLSRRRHRRAAAVRSGRLRKRVGQTSDRASLDGERRSPPTLRGGRQLCVMTQTTNVSTEVWCVWCLFAVVIHDVHWKILDSHKGNVCCIRIAKVRCHYLLLFSCKIYYSVINYSVQETCCLQIDLERAGS